MQANDFGSEVIPGAKDLGMHVQAYLYDGYWEDIGTIEAFYQANLALTKNPKPDYRYTGPFCCSNRGSGALVEVTAPIWKFALPCYVIFLGKWIYTNCISFLAHCSSHDTHLKRFYLTCPQIMQNSVKMLLQQVMQPQDRMLC